MDVLNTALSGLNAAERRIGNAAHNIANANTPNFKPTETVQRTAANGGVQVDVVERSGTLNETPFVSQDEQIVSMVAAKSDYEANLAVIKKNRGMDEALLDIQA